MSANSRFTIAVHTLAVLALSDNAVSSSYIAGSTGSNPVTIRNMLGDLRKAGLVSTTAGSTGGSRLTRPASRISLADIHQAVEQDHLFEMHYSKPDISCPIGRNIQNVLTDVYSDAFSALLAKLKITSLADVVAGVTDLSIEQSDK